MRVRSWPRDPSTAFLTLQGAHDAGAIMPHSRVISSWLDRIRDCGYTHVRTSALSASARRALEPHGFTVCQQLTLLSSTQHDGNAWAPRSELLNSTFVFQDTSMARLRLRRAEHARVLEVDESAFGRPWCLDAVALFDAFHATRHARIFVARSHSIDGYVVVGATPSRRHTTGFVQRLAVHGSMQRNGLGKALLRHALRWLSTQGCGTVYVNTEHTNHAALSLYQHHGFRTLPHELTVLECDVITGTSS